MASKKGIDLEFSIAEGEALKSIRDLTNQISVMNKELNFTDTVLKNDNASIEDYKNKLNVLNKEKEVFAKKVEEANKMLEKAKETYGENSTEVEKWQKKLYDAKTEQQKVENQIQSTTKAINEFGNETDNAAKKTSIFGEVLKANLIGDAIVFGLKKTVDGIKQIASSVVDLTKKSIENYAEYEQLIGGVETLFGESAGIVQDYANDAYKTAGLSANKYMETVTSFSASLLQSLDGDTEKAAKVADMAITDMADNANKMGTSIEMIQNAYQGFAKQNYTMLDNLKLGYGGTKSEMERLLADAQKISGIKYDISNLSDVYEAIHVIQTEMKISGLSYEEAMAKVASGEMTLEEATEAMGTTAKEASSTISGSINSMKSSWNNFLTGLANGNADLSKLINNVVDSVLTVADNLMPVIAQVTDSIIAVMPEILNKIIENLPRFLEAGSSILTSLINGLTANMDKVMDAVMQIIKILTGTFIKNLPQIIEMGLTILLSLISGITESLPELVPVIVDIIMKISEILIDNLPTIIMAGIEILIALIEGIIEAIPQLIQFIPTIIDKIVESLIEALPMLLYASLRIIVELGKGLIVAIPQLIAMIPQVIAAIVDGLINGVTSMLEVGKNLVEGLWQGIKDSFTWIKNKITEWVGNIMDFIKKLFGIKSPSKIMKEQVGLNLGLGVAEGIEDSISEVNKAMGGLQSSVMGQIEPSINIGSATSDGVELGVGRPLYINIAEFNNNREQDVEAFAEELAIILRQKELV